MKKIVGIVAEYNPFHDGHQYHIEETKRKIGEDAVIVCVMSGDFVQRGEWAIYPKFLRAAQAIRGGANLVIELPLPWCLASGERFAFGAVSLLANLKATYISFGSESAEINSLRKIAECMSEESFHANFLMFRKKNPELTDAAARATMLGYNNTLGPNDILGIEYLRAASSFGLEAILIQRSGNRHDSDGENGFLSASQIRREIYNGKRSGTPVDCDRLELAAISRLRMFNKEYFNDLPFCENGLGNRIYDAVRVSNSLAQMYDIVKTKRFTHAAIRRAAMCAVLGVKQEYCFELPGYGRILAADRIGVEHLHEIKDNGFPLISRARDIQNLTIHDKKCFSLGALAHDFYMLGWNNGIEQCGEDYRFTPFIQQLL